VAKPARPVAGVPLLARVLAAVAAAPHRVVVGPPALTPLVPSGVRLTLEQPPGGGPVAACAAGLAALTGAGVADDHLVAVLAADLPFLSTAAVQRLAEAAAPAGVDGAVLLDGDARPQWLCGVWRVAALRRRIDALGAPAGHGMRELAAGPGVVRVAADPSGPPAWFDCDTEEDLREAEVCERRRFGMATLDEWTAQAGAALGVDAGAIDRDLVLDRARDVAHAVARPAAPLTAYLVGIAVGRGIEPTAAAATITDLADQWATTKRAAPNGTSGAEPTDG
jgi:molybdopterin-guanine dinucleotide biosynthesis protein A